MYNKYCIIKRLMFQLSLILGNSILYIFLQNKVSDSFRRENDDTEKILEKNLHNHGICRIERESITGDDTRETYLSSFVSFLRSFLSPAFALVEAFESSKIVETLIQLGSWTWSSEFGGFHRD